MTEDGPADPIGSQPALDLGARLRAQRLSTGLSLREMARRLKRSPSAISQFETGKARPSVSTLFEMVDLLGISIDTLLGTEEPGTEQPGSAAPRTQDLPGIPDLHAGALGAAVLDMPNRVILERAADHPCIELENTVQWTRLSRSMSGVEFLLVTYPPGSWSSGADGRFMHHAGHEFGYLLHGLLTVEISFDNHLDRYDVRAGDSITFPAAIAHRLGNRSSEPAAAIWCIFAAGGASSIHENGVRVSPPGHNDSFSNS
jgi:transcriptional regulator with XRE-family HTH domain